MNWLPIKKVTDCPQNYIDDFFIRYNQGRDKETGDAFKIKELFENGWSDLEYLDESTPSKEGEEEAVEILNWLAHINVNGYKGTEFSEIILVDGEYYYKLDEDGDQPITPQQLYKIFKQSKGTTT